MPFGILNDELAQASDLQGSDLSLEAGAQATSVFYKFSWTNNMIVGLGATDNGTLVVTSLPPKTLVKRAYIVITGQEQNLTTLDVAMGRTGASYDDYVKAVDGQAAAGTVYGSDIATNLGANLEEFVGDLPSMTSSTDVKIRFESTGGDLDEAVGSSGDIYLETVTLG